MRPFEQRCVAGAFCLALSLTACGPSPAVVTQSLSTGFLTLEWTLAGVKDESQCGARGATGLEVNVYTSLAEWLVAWAVPCRHFLTGTEITEGTYKLLVRLIDTDHVTIGDAQRVDAIVVVPNAEAIATVDFPTPPAAAAPALAP